MKKMKAYFLFVLIASMTFLSCEKDKDDNNNNTSRVIKYEVSGNYTGSLIASYTTASGGTTNETIPALPWSKEVTYASNVTAAILAVTGNGGVAGQKVTVIVKKGGSQISSTVMTAETSGSFSKPTPSVTF